MKTAHKGEACVLRKNGWSLGEISRKFCISKSTASLWTKDVILTDVGVKRVTKNREMARLRSGVVLHDKKLARLKAAEAEACIRFVDKKINKELSILSMIYQCEGSKLDKFCFTNSDPELVGYFLKLFRGVFKIEEDKLRVIIHIHDYHDEKEVLKFWSSITKIPLKQFNKSYKKFSKHTYRKNGYMGCAHIYYYDFHVSRVIKAFAKKLMRTYSGRVVAVS